MMARTDKYLLDLEAPDHKVWNVAADLYGSVQIQLVDGAWGSAVVTVQVSNDGRAWFDLPLPVSFSANGISRELDLSGYLYLRVRTTTIAGAAGIAEVVACFKREAA